MRYCYDSMITTVARSPKYIQSNSELKTTPKSKLWLPKQRLPSPWSRQREPPSNARWAPPVPVSDNATTPPIRNNYNQDIPTDRKPTGAHPPARTWPWAPTGFRGCRCPRAPSALSATRGTRAPPRYESPILQNGCRTRIRYGPIRVSGSIEKIWFKNKRFNSRYSVRYFWANNTSFERASGAHQRRLIQVELIT